MLLDRVRHGVDRDLVTRRVVLDPEVEVDELRVEVGQDQLVLDERPDDAGHLVAVELDDRVRDLILARRSEIPYRLRGAGRGMLSSGTFPTAP